MDLRRIGRTIAIGSLSVIVANPPYAKEGAGRTSPDETRRIARLAELVTSMRKRTLEPKRLRLVHPYADRSASLALVEAVKGGRAGVEVLAPLIVHERGGGYSKEMQEIYGLGLVTTGICR